MRAIIAIRRRLDAVLVCGLLLLTFCLGALPHKAAAATSIVQSITAGSTSTAVTTISGTLPATATTNDLLVVICGAGASSTITGPSGFSSAINQAGTASQGIFYKISAGTEKTLSCTSSASTSLGIQIIEYNAVITTSPVDSTGSSSGSGTAISTGSVTTTNADDLLVGGAITEANTTISSWGSSFTLRNNFTTTVSPAKNTIAFGGGDRIVSATGSYSGTATAGSSGSWRAQVAAFKIKPSVLGADVVDGSGNSVSSPSASLGSSSVDFTCDTVTGTLGTSTQKIRVNNTTSTATWTLSIGATSGNTASWTAGSHHYDFNDPTSSGCSDGSDADSYAGQLTIDPSGATITPASGCTTTGVSVGASDSFNQGTTDAITLANATSSSKINCTWDITNIGLSQTIPASTFSGSYTLGMTLTITAS